MSFRFEAFKEPFPRWMGPYSPARGTRAGFRFHAGRFGTWVEDGVGASFWAAVPDGGVRRITALVLDKWDGGRVLLLPNGFAIKPLQGRWGQDDEVGHRVIIGRFAGGLTLERPDGSVFDMSEPGDLQPGALWPGPRTTGLECAMQPDGRLTCRWYHPSRFGRDEVWRVLREGDRALASAFRRARPSNAGGRVRITVNGHVITNRQLNGVWTSRYVGHVAAKSFLDDWHDWIMKD